MRFLPLILVIFACNKAAEPSTDGRRAELQASFDSKMQEYKAKTSETYGWPSSNDCDGVLWAGIACYAGAEVNIDLAEYDSGRIERRPPPSCYPDDSQSTISRDQLTGYMACRWRKNDTEALKRLADYGEAHNWIMGEPGWKVDLVFMGQNLQAILGKMIGRYADLQITFAPLNRDFERHIQTWQLVLLGDLGKLDFLQLDRVRQNVKYDSQDALFQATKGRYTGDMQDAVTLLLSPDYKCPSYVRGADNYCLVHWLSAARVALDSLKEE
jgi:hypothetical protein